MLQTVKQKIRWGTLFLFLLLLLLGGTGIFYIVRLKNDSGIILRNNYESLDFCHQMQRALDSIPQNPPAYIQQFDSALALQETNFTEQSEIGPSKKIRVLFEKLRSGNYSPALANEIRANIQIVLKANMMAIESKSNRASVTAERALTYITLIATIIFLIGLSFSYNFPSIVTGPIEAFTRGIREIATKKYHHRIHLDRKDEFGQMADAFNAMAARLEYFESSNLNQVIFEKTRAEAVINSLKDAS
ncbi:MAG TPA: HAMP domain-containing protein, partial [Flavitalea sp.]|nr:HAMP domain-containing protein [Flavitalea sp.]